MGMKMKILTTAALFITLTGLGLAGVKPAVPEHPGMIAFKAKDYATAYKIWAPLAAHGDANAEVNLGIMYAHGLGVERNPETAMQLFQESAAQGNGQAQFQLGLLYAKGVGVQQNYGEAMR